MIIRQVSGEAEWLSHTTIVSGAAAACTSCENQAHNFQEFYKLLIKLLRA